MNKNKKLMFFYIRLCLLLQSLYREVYEVAEMGTRSLDFLTRATTKKLRQRQRRDRWYFFKEFIFSSPQYTMLDREQGDRFVTSKLRGRKSNYVACQMVFRNNRDQVGT